MENGKCVERTLLKNKLLSLEISWKDKVVCWFLESFSISHGCRLLMDKQERKQGKIEEYFFLLFFHSCFIDNFQFPRSKWSIQTFLLYLPYSSFVVSFGRLRKQIKRLKLLFLLSTLKLGLCSLLPFITRISLIPSILNPENKNNIKNSPSHSRSARHRIKLQKRAQKANTQNNKKHKCFLIFFIKLHLASLLWEFCVMPLAHIHCCFA